MVKVTDPQIGETVYDPASGTGGFLAQAYEHMSRPTLRPSEIETLKHSTFFGREKDNTIYPIALANLVLHGIDHPNLWHGNTLTGREDYGELFRGAPARPMIMQSKRKFVLPLRKNVQHKLNHVEYTLVGR